jgi:molybdate transport system ATP-binding protein
LTDGLDLNLVLQRESFVLRANLCIRARGLTALFGRSGAGKSTLLRTITGLERDAEGSIHFAGDVWQDGSTFVPTHKRRIGYVFQDSRLFPHLNVRTNLEYGLKRAGERPGPTMAEVAALLGIESLLDRKPATLSGGEAQRVTIGRAFLSRPRLLLMDEPLASLDQARKAEILPFIEKLRDVAEIPIIYVSHSVAEVARLSNHIVLMDQGSVTMQGEATDLFADPKAAALLGIQEAGAVLHARIERQHADGLTELAVAGGSLFLSAPDFSVGRLVRVRVAAQDVMIALKRPDAISALNILPVTIQSITGAGQDGVLLGLDCCGDRLLARITRRSLDSLGLGPGLKCFAVLKSVALAQSDIGFGAT